MSFPYRNYYNPTPKCNTGPKDAKGPLSSGRHNQLDLWTFGPLDLWPLGPLHRCTVGPVDPWTVGWTVGPLAPGLVSLAGSFSLRSRTPTSADGLGSFLAFTGDYSGHGSLTLSSYWAGCLDFLCYAMTDQIQPGYWTYAAETLSPLHAEV